MKVEDAQPADDATALPTRLAGFPIVDAHVHVFPPGIFDAVWGWFDRYGWPIRYRLQARHATGFLLERGIQRLVILQYAHRPGIAAGLNRFAAELAESEPRLIPCATVCPGEQGARAILDQALGPLACRGVKIHCHVQCVAADDPRLDDVYDAAAAHGVPVVIHAGDAPWSPHYRCDVRALCRPQALDRALRRHPRTTVVLPHLGMSWIDEAERLLGDHQHLYLDTTMTLARFFPLDPLDTKVREVGDEEVAAWLERPLAMLRAFPERILYGSDFPNLPYAWDRELATLAGLDLPEPALAAILGGNALRLFAPSK